MQKKQVKILFASYECAPFVKLGGLADVAGSLPKEITKLGGDIRVVVPYYKKIKEKYADKIKKTKDNLHFSFGGKDIFWSIYESTLPGSNAKIYFIENKEFFDVDDIFAEKPRTRFILFSHLTVRLMQEIDFQADILHCHDWHTANIPMIINEKKNEIFYDKNIKTLFTIHNIGYAGRVKPYILKKFGFKTEDFMAWEEGKKVNLMEEAIMSADAVSTVSPTYAREILTREYGYDMTDSLQKRKKDLYGIINGLDYSIFDPKTDESLITNYSPEEYEGKKDNKKYLQKISGFEIGEDKPIIGLVSRLAGQKGFDILEEAFAEIMKLDARLVILGTGDKKFEEFFAKMNDKYAGKFHAHIKFSVELASQVYAGSDMFLMPSKYEPCGLTQMIAMKYGSVPVVRATGGLKDTVKHGKTGFVFKKYEAKELINVIKTAVKAYQNRKKWLKIEKNCLEEKFTWNKSAKKYMRLYKKLKNKK